MPILDSTIKLLLELMCSSNRCYLQSQCYSNTYKSLVTGYNTINHTPLSIEYTWIYLYNGTSVNIVQPYESFYYSYDSILQSL